MKVKELAELFMLRLYEYGEREGYDKYMDLQPVAASLGVNDWAKVANVAQFLEHQGLVHEVVLTSGQSSARVTGEGQLSVEEGGETGVIARFKENPAAFLVNVDQSAHFHGDVTSSAVAVHSSVWSQRLGTEVEELLEQLVSTIACDSNLAEEDRKDLSGDVSLLRAELNRRRASAGDHSPCTLVPGRCRFAHVSRHPAGNHSARNLTFLEAVLIWLETQAGLRGGRTNRILLGEKSSPNRRTPPFSGPKQLARCARGAVPAADRRGVVPAIGTT